MAVRKSAKSVDLATKLALEELGLSIQEAEITIISEGSRGFLGIGGKDACVEVCPKSAVKEETDKVEPAAAPENMEPVSQPVQEPVKRASVSAEEIDEASKIATEFLADLFQSMNIEAEMTTNYQDEMLHINIVSPSMGIIIGKRGETMDSIQYLTSLVVNRKTSQYMRIALDGENYRAKREEALQRLAHKLAAKVKDSHRKYTLEPMSAYERRIIHASLQADPYVTTYSVGDEPYRKVVIAPKR